MYVIDDLLAKNEIQNSALTEWFYGFIKDKVLTSHILNKNNKTSKKTSSKSVLTKENDRHISKNDPLILKVFSLMLPTSNKIQPPLTYELETDTKLKENDKIKVIEFLHDCERLGLETEEQINWYVELLRNPTRTISDFAKLLEMEIKNTDDCYETSNLNHKNFSLMHEYHEQTSWALRLAIETLTLDKTWSLDKTTKLEHDLMKIRQRYFACHMLYHIRNTNYLLQKELSDTMVTKHSDVEYFYNTFSHLGITESYPTVNGRQAKMSAERDVKQQLPDLENRTTIHR